jgi:hypothetical protein
LAKEELAFSLAEDYSQQKIYMPIIVTNATLTVCSFAPNNINISTGDLSLEDAEFESVPYIRFQKGLETNILGSKLQLGMSQGLELKDINAEKERTVFVVNSEHLRDFFENCDLVPNQNVMQHPWVSLDQIYYSMIIKYINRLISNSPVLPSTS